MYKSQFIFLYKTKKNRKILFTSTYAECIEMCAKKVPPILWDKRQCVSKWTLICTHTYTIHNTLTKIPQFLWETSMACNCSQKMDTAHISKKLCLPLHMGFLITGLQLNKELKITTLIMYTFYKREVKSNKVQIKYSTFTVLSV